MQDTPVFKIGIKGGKIFFTPPVDGDRLPSITPDFNVVLRVNGQDIMDKTTVNQEDQVELEPREEIVTGGSMEVTLSQDKYTAYLAVNPAVKKTFFLVDKEPREHLRLETREKTVKVNDIPREQVLKELERLNIRYGILEGAVEEILERHTGKPEIVAKGQEPEQGQDAQIEIYFKKESSLSPSINSRGKVDYRDILRIPFVDTGTVLARKVPVVGNLPGITVTGEEINLVPPRDIVIKADRTARLCSDGTELLAVASGYPVVEKKGDTYEFRVKKNYVHQGGVDLSSGNIRFQGELDIKGAVTEGMVVQGGRNVLIGGDITGASVHAGGNIEARHNIINSSLRAGTVNSTLHKLYPVIEVLEENIERLRVTVEALNKHPKFINNYIKGTVFLKIVRLLTATVDKFTIIREEVKKFRQVRKEIEDNILSFNLPPDLVKTIRRVEQDMALLFTSDEEKVVIFETIQMMLAYIKEEVERHPDFYSDITIGYCLNSILEATGDINITSKGSYQSQVVAGGRVQVFGAVRGGSVKAGKDVYINEIGSPAAVLTQVQVPAKCKIHLKKAFENSTIAIGRQIFRFSRYQTNVDAHVADGVIRLFKA